jgi:HAD superfamily hydrolase (TIGR01459 family)
MQLISRLSEIADRYDALLCDVWGVIRDGRSLLPPARDALRRFRETRGPVCLVSNSPQRSVDMISYLESAGLTEDCWDAAVTSGDAIRAALSARAPGPAYRIGPSRDDRLYLGLDLDFSSLDQARFIACSGLNDEFAETPEDYRPVLEEARARDLDLVCANPDIVVQEGDQLVWCAGALARLYREMGGQSVIAGKPHRPIYRLALERLGHAGEKLDRILAIGDGPETDLEGARRIGVDALFIAGGILGDNLAAAFTPETLQAVLKEYGADPAWAAPHLEW